MARSKRSRRPRRPGRSRPSRARRALARALIGTAAALVVLALAALGWLTLIFPHGAGPGTGREVRIELAAGSSVEEATERLVERGLLRRPRVFIVYARMLGAEAHLREGEVLLTDDMSPQDVLQRISLGLGQATVRVTIPEGFDRFDIAARLERWEVCPAPDFVAATEDRVLLDELGIEAPSAEGYLFPDTHRFRVGLDARDVVRVLVAGYRRRVEPTLADRAAGLERLREALDFGPHEVLVLASIVEKEAAVADERPIIAGVFLNRLKDPTFRPRRLQADPTVSYGCRAFPEAPSCHSFDGRAITRAMLQDRENPYNTYRHEGLPPGPIANPGLDSIRAVLDPAEHEYLYFVARGHGRHTFSRTLGEHEAAVQQHRSGR